MSGYRCLALQQDVPKLAICTDLAICSADDAADITARLPSHVPCAVTLLGLFRPTASPVPVPAFCFYDNISFIRHVVILL